MPPGTTVPEALLPRSDADGGATAASVVQHTLRGRCLLVLGDSTATETVHDLVGMLLNLTDHSLRKYLQRAVRMPKAAQARVDLANEHGWLPTRQTNLVRAAACLGWA